MHVARATPFVVCCLCTPRPPLDQAGGNRLSSRAVHERFMEDAWVAILHVRQILPTSSSCIFWRQELLLPKPHINRL